MSISYAITACNEHEELKRLLTILDQNIQPEDEIVLQLDAINSTHEVKEIASYWGVERMKEQIGGEFTSKDTPARYEYRKIWGELNGDFASFKNYLKKHCVKDYIFFIDADEYPTDTLLSNLPLILETNPEVEMFNIPRVNEVKGITPEHIKKWGWRINEFGWINYPDYQTRIIKNIPTINWEGKVHERLIGAKVITAMPVYQDLELIHPKTIEKQEKQNNFYNTL